MELREAGGRLASRREARRVHGRGHRLVFSAAASRSLPETLPFWEKRDSRGRSVPVSGENGQLPNSIEILLSWQP